MRPDVLLHLMRLLDECNASCDAKSEFRSLIKQVGIAHGVGALEREARVRFARHLLDVREPRHIVRDRIMARFGVGDSQAYRDIDRALQKTVPNLG